MGTNKIQSTHDTEKNRKKGQGNKYVQEKA